MKEVVPPSVIVVTRAILGISVSKVWKDNFEDNYNVARMYKGSVTRRMLREN